MCVFCKIINNEIPSKKVYEDESVLAILDLSQLEKGHTLVIPKKHYDTFLECDKDTIDHVIEVTQKLAIKIKNNLSADGVNVLNNSYAAAGQSVMHTHFHIIPRYNNDDFGFKEVNHEGKYDLDKVLEEINK